MKRTLIAAALALTAITSAHAATITGLKNTGLGDSGSVDSNYSLSSAVSSTPIITVDGQWPISPWLANDSTSKWITPTSNQAESFDPWSNGTYTYTLTFDLSGYNAATAVFTGRLAADNSVVVKLNNSVISSATGFTDWTSFGASSGFVSGVNTLDFVVNNWAQNGGNPTGLRVEFGMSSIAAVPEPATYAMLLGGLVMVGAIARRRKQ
ncbi:PEP-CTERM protein-sorting domain-containing protein [Duganella sp. CF402]|uniref:PEP-CTERM sorting domain-containing protein n=1 Tax=unclassified Duganella TaxID=2636909 RepID=UPI0008B75041|nr:MULTISPECIES: PEP-CTERM sorting domain-containing protein [unclassified Duganella]RZT10541.1 putative secreted protein with PEP-CTERM sorting signal [Duganella sp. BK701]SEL09057.1 PEP-CTERM protein-sorting domain-containing protein [Duganella sp. CF402]